MYNEDALNVEGITPWQLIEKQYLNSSILLGNGFSINFSDTLRYKNLYDFFIKKSTIESKSLFDGFQTRNFEKVLEGIETAGIVCDALKIDTKLFDVFKQEIRQGLIDSINSIHPRPISVDYDLINKIAIQFQSFNQIFTTNYDLFLYYIVLETKKFGDHFFNQLSSKYNYYLEPDKMRRNHIYFLHGALFLFESGLKTLKILRPAKGWLLNIITEEISNNNYPLFISEGKSETKLKAIQSNKYLSFCFEKLKRPTDTSLVIFGQSLSEQDRHIIEAIDGRFNKIAISIRIEDWQTFGDLIAEKRRLMSLLKKTKCQFFDAKTLFRFN